VQDLKVRAGGSGGQSKNKQVKAESEARPRKVFENCTDAVFLADAEGLIRYWMSMEPRAS
jgi:hypothetical protein